MQQHHDTAQHWPHTVTLLQRYTSCLSTFTSYWNLAPSSQHSFNFYLSHIFTFSSSPLLSNRSIIYSIFGTSSVQFTLNNSWISNTRHAARLLLLLCLVGEPLWYCSLVLLWQGMVWAWLHALGKCCPLLLEHRSTKPHCDDKKQHDIFSNTLVKFSFAVLSSSSSSGCCL